MKLSDEKLKQLYALILAFVGEDEWRVEVYEADNGPPGAFFEPLPQYRINILPRKKGS